MNTQNSKRCRSANQPRGSTQALLVVDQQSPDLSELINASNISCHQLQIKDEPISAISHLLNQFRLHGEPVADLHLLAHGNSNGFWLNQQHVNAKDVLKQHKQLANWGIKRLFLWSCELGNNAPMLALLAEHTNADIYSSSGRLSSNNTWITNQKQRLTSLASIIDSAAIKKWGGELSTYNDDEYVLREGRGKDKIGRSRGLFKNDREAKRDSAILITSISSNQNEPIELTQADENTQKQATVVTSYGTLIIKEDGSFDYRADQSDSDSLPAEAEYMDQFTCSILDGNTQATSTSKVTFKITGENDAPEANNDTISVNAAESISELAAGLLANDTDVDTDAALSIIGIRTGRKSADGNQESLGIPLIGTYGQLTLQSDGSYAYSADQDASTALPSGEIGIDTFTYTLSDNTDTDRAELIISIIGMNHPTIISGDFSATVQEGDLGDDPVIATGTLTISDPDEDDNPSFPDLLREGDFGTFSLISGNWTYILDQSKAQQLQQGEEAIDSFNILANDNREANISITVIGSGITAEPESTTPPPVANHDSYQTEGEANNRTAINPGDTKQRSFRETGLLRNDQHALDNPSVIVSAIRTGTLDQTGSNVSVGSPILGSYGRLTVNNDGSFEYFADPESEAGISLAAGELGNDDFTYTISDGTHSSSALLTFAITGLNDAPSLSAPPNGLIAELDQSTAITSSALSGILSGSDPDSLDQSQLTYGINGGSATAGGGKISLAGDYGTLYLIPGNGVYSYIPNLEAIEELQSGESALDGFSLYVSDGSSSSNAAYVVEISGSDEAPEPEPQTEPEPQPEVDTQPDTDTTPTEPDPTPTEADNNGSDNSASDSTINFITININIGGTNSPIALINTLLSNPAAKGYSSETLLRSSTSKHNNLINAKLPAKLSLNQQGPEQAQKLKLAKPTLNALLATLNTPEQANINQAATRYFNNLPNRKSARVDLRAITAQSLKSNNKPLKPLTLSGNSKGGHEAFILDARSLPSQTTLRSNHIGFISLLGTIKLIGGKGNNMVIGDNKSQKISGGGGNDNLNGGGGKDTLKGDAGNDSLDGGGGKDKLNGGDGKDTLDGGAGKDTLTGAQGPDQFILSKGADRITDYTPATGDRLVYDKPDQLRLIQKQSNLLLKGPGGIKTLLLDFNKQEFNQEDVLAVAIDPLA